MKKIAFSFGLGLLTMIALHTLGDMLSIHSLMFEYHYTDEQTNTRVYETSTIPFFVGGIVTLVFLSKKTS